MDTEWKIAPKMSQDLMQALKAEYGSQSFFHLTENAGRQRGNALCEQRFVDRDELGNINDRILW
jgi:hypothetical protein